jgi:hypothetical protein
MSTKYDPNLSPEELAALQEFESAPDAVLDPAPIPAQPVVADTQQNPSPAAQPPLSETAPAEHRETAEPTAKTYSESDLRAMQGRFEAAEAERKREAQFAALNHERAENFARENESVKATAKTLAQEKQALEARIAELTRPKRQLPERLANALDPEAAAELQAYIDSATPSDVVKKSEVEAIINAEIERNRKQNEARAEESQKTVFRDEVRKDMPDLTKKEEVDAFFKWASEHPAQPVASIVTTIEKGDLRGLSQLKYWYGEFSKTKPQGTSALAQSASLRTVASGSSSAASVPANWEAQHEQLLRQRKFVEAQALLDKYEAATAS